LDDPNASQDGWEADNEYDTELDNGIEARDSPEYPVLSAAPNVPGSNWPTPRSTKQAQKGLMTVAAV